MREKRSEYAKLGRPFTVAFIDGVMNEITIEPSSKVFLFCLRDGPSSHPESGFDLNELRESVRERAQYFLFSQESEESVYLGTINDMEKMGLNSLCMHLLLADQDEAIYISAAKQFSDLLKICQTFSFSPDQDIVKLDDDAGARAARKILFHAVAAVDGSPLFRYLLFEDKQDPMREDEFDNMSAFKVASVHKAERNLAFIAEKSDRDDE